ncbi:MAG: hypothetical protein AAGF28_10685 [Pseudomonadota bacterium]
MDDRTAQIATICECIDQSFAFAIWRDDFARNVDPDDMIWGLERGFDLVADATRLLSFLALRKMDDFFVGAQPRPDDLTASKFEIDIPTVLGEVGTSFLKSTERTNISKGVAHLTERLHLDPDSEVDLQEIVKRSIPVFSRLIVQLRTVDHDQEAADKIDRTQSLIKRASAL